MGKIFCVEFQRYPLKFHTKYLTHTLVHLSTCSGLTIIKMAMLSQFLRVPWSFEIFCDMFRPGLREDIEIWWDDAQYMHNVPWSRSLWKMVVLGQFLLANFWFHSICPSVPHGVSTFEHLQILMDSFHIGYKWSLAWEGVLPAMIFDLDLCLQGHSAMTLQ